MKFCTYCGIEHERRGRACSEYCERKTRNSKAAVTMGRNRAVRSIMVGQQTLLRHRTRWRNVAMGRGEGTNLANIFEMDMPPVMKRR